MSPGDLLRNVRVDGLFGVLLEVKVDERLMKHKFSIPWRYRVLWTDGSVKEHEMGTVRRIMIHEAR